MKISDHLHPSSKGNLNISHAAKIIQKKFIDANKILINLIKFVL